MNKNVDISTMITVSNLPETISQSELSELFRSVGRIESLDITRGNNTVSARIQYTDAELAQMAIQLLDGHIMGGKPLHVIPYSPSAAGGPSHDGSTLSSAQHIDQHISDADVRGILGTMTEHEQAQILCEFRHLALAHPIVCRNMLINSPQLSHAILRLMTMFKMVDKSSVSTFISDNTHTALNPQQQHGHISLTDEDSTVLHNYNKLPTEKRQHLRTLSLMSPQEIHTAQLPPDVLARLHILKKLNNLALLK